MKKITTEDRAQAKAQAQAEAKRLLDAWPCMSSVLDRVALIVLESETDMQLRRIVEREYDADYDYSGCLSYFFSEAMRRIPGHVATFAASSESEGASVDDLLADARSEFEQIKTQLGVRHIAGLWQSRIEQAAHLYLRAVKLTA